MSHLVLAITASYKGGCGKTTLALAMALRRARRGDRVLFLDADFTGTCLADALLDYPPAIERPARLDELLGRPPRANDLGPADCVDEIPVAPGKDPVREPGGWVSLAASRTDDSNRHRLLPVLLASGDIPYAALRLDGLIRDWLKSLPDPTTTTLIVMDNGPGIYGLVEQLKAEPLLRTIEFAFAGGARGRSRFEDVTVLFMPVSGSDRQDVLLAADQLQSDWFEGVVGPKARFRKRLVEHAEDRSRPFQKRVDVTPRSDRAEEDARRAELRLHLRIVPVVNQVVGVDPIASLPRDKYERLLEPGGVLWRGVSPGSDFLMTGRHLVQVEPSPTPPKERDVILFVPHDPELPGKNFSFLANLPAGVKSRRGAEVLLQPGLDGEKIFQPFLRAMDGLIDTPMP